MAVIVARMDLDIEIKQCFLVVLFHASQVNLTQFGHE